MSVTSPTAHDRAVAAFDLDDIFLIEQTAMVDREFNQTDGRALEHMTVQRVRVDQQIYAQSRTPLNDPTNGFLIARFFVICEILLGKPGAAVVENDVKEADRLATFVHTFAADYRVKDSQTPDQEMLAAFIPNVVFNVWPYWREAVSAQGAKMRLPTVMVPLMKSSKSSSGPKFTVGGVAADVPDPLNSSRHDASAP